MKVIRKNSERRRPEMTPMNFRERLKNLDAPEEVKERSKGDLAFSGSLNSPAENGVIRTYIETMLECRGIKRAEDCGDMEYAKKSLEQEGTMDWKEVKRNVFWNF